MSGPIICGVDDSPGARDAVRAALALSARAELPLVFVHVAPDQPRLSRRDPQRRRALAESVSIGIDLLDRTTQRLARGHDATTHVALGDPAKQLAAVAASTGAEMVVVGSRGRRRLRAALLGSVSRALVALCRSPVLVVSPGARLPEGRQGESSPSPSVLCAIDGSPESIHAASAASRLAARLDDRLVLAHAYRPLRPNLAGRYEAGPIMSAWKAAPAVLATAEASLEHATERAPERTLEPGDPRQALIRAAGRENAELLVLGAHPDRPRVRRSVAATLVASSPIPTLIVPPPTVAGAHDDLDVLRRARSVAAA